MSSCAPIPLPSPVPSPFNLVPAVLGVVDQVAKLLMGNSKSVDLGPLVEANQRALAQQQANFERGQNEQREQHKQDMAAIEDRHGAEAKRMEQAFAAQQLAHQRAAAAERTALQASLVEMRQAVETAQAASQNLMEELARPAQRMAEKRAFVNNLRIAIRMSDKLLALGVKGSFKSTFYYLYGLSPNKPIFTGADGTSSIVHLQQAIDSIGLLGWNQTDIVKLVVLLIYTGLPADLLLFCGERTAEPILQLGMLGIQGPLIVSMCNSFWASAEPQDGSEADFTLVPTVQGGRTVLRVEPENQLRRAYNMRKYRDLMLNGQGRGVTHHDDVLGIVAQRKAAGTLPFSHLAGLLGATFTVSEASDPIVQMLFRFIYIYEKKYKQHNKGQVEFMNKAALSMFEDA
jgi:hypothetical protein